MVSRLRSRRGMSLVEMLVTLALLGLFMMGIVIVMRGIEASWRSAMVRVPLAATTALVGQLMTDQLGRTHCIDEPPAPTTGASEGNSLVGRVGPGCIDPAFNDEGVETFKFCVDPAPASALRYWRGVGAAPAGCSGASFYTVSNPLAVVSLPAGAGGAFRRPAGFPSRVDVRVRLHVPLPVGDESFWDSGENERVWEDSFTAGAMPLEAP